MLDSFEIGNWLDTHSAKYNLSSSAITLDLTPYFKVNSTVNETQLKELIAEINGVHPSQVVVTQGATEGLFLVLLYLYRKGYKSYNVKLPDYETIFKVPEIVGLTKGGDDIFVSSNTNNPLAELRQCDDSYKVCVMDETFLAFHQDLDKVDYYNDNVFRVNTLSKFYGASIVRIGYIIAPSSEDAKRLEGYKGLIVEPPSPHNMSIAYNILKDHYNIAEKVRHLVKENLEFLKREKRMLRFYKDVEPLLSTVSFIDYSYYTEMSSRELAEYLVSKGILVVPGYMFGVDGPYMRVCYSRSDFKESFKVLIEELEKIKETGDDIYRSAPKR
ncbi:MAG: pyridoxal phosphate-dependent aminotransferase [Sulfolobaceae archaeon]|nr:pyridoxal phosphate-dependent aminotransferase [Sulfolobaceae archaeon]